MLRIGLLIIALVAGGGAAWVALQMSRAPVADKTAGPVGPVMQDVLVAAADLGIGQALTKENMRWVSSPENAIGPGYIVRSARPDALESFANRLVRNRMASGEPIRDDTLIPANASFLATKLPPGKRAVAVRISAENTAGGFILPGDRVDVLVTAGADKSQLFTRRILSNVPVRAIDQILDENSSKDDKSKGKTGLIGKTATLELDPSQVEILATGEALGKLSLALRSAAENDEGPPGVLVASADLRPGQRLTRENMRWQPQPESALNRADINRSERPDAVENLAGAIVRSAIASGEPIRDENLAALTAGFLSATLKSGKRAVAVPISAQNTAGGFILPNDRVDVILTKEPPKNTTTTTTPGQSVSTTTLTPQGPGVSTTTTQTPLEQSVSTAQTQAGESSSRTILWNVPVLAIDQTVDESEFTNEAMKGGNGKAKAAAIGKTATLELDPSQVEILTAAEMTGTLSLALRSAKDNCEEPPLTRLESSPPVWNRRAFGRIVYVQLVKSEKPVEITVPNKSSSPACAPEQRVAGEPRQARQNVTGVAPQ